MTSVWRFLWRGVRIYYDAFILPRAKDEDSRRREFIFNIIVSTIFTILAVFGLQIVHVELVTPGYSGVGHGTFIFFLAFFSALLYLSRKGHTAIASYLLIGLYFLGNTYGLYQWGIELPAAILGYAVTILISSILISTRVGFAMTAIVSASTLFIGYVQTHGIVHPDLAWRTLPMEWNDSFENSLLYSFAMVVAWLSNREIAASLSRARKSEAALTEERNLLEVRIEDRTKELKAAELEKISQLYRFVEFGRLSSGIFHDLMNPITTLALSIEQLSEKPSSLSSEMKDQIDRAIRASKRIESFIELAKKQLDTEGERGIFALENETRDAIDLLLHKSRMAGVEIRLESPGNTLIHGNSVKFFQIASNLISNAIDSYKNVSRIPNVECRVLVLISRTDNGVEFLVTDEGCGIPEDAKKVIFAPFFSTKSKRDGMGLGLSMTKELVEKDFGGTIAVESEEGKGTTFTIHIPIDRMAEDRRRKTGGLHYENRSDKEKVPHVTAFESGTKGTFTSLASEDFKK
ncbi:MAG TPA: HAMP domain-containing sensor histidine kinase [Candidatus Paceibacterota bacterium]|jgi:Signal transduction histidine kinase